MKELTMKMQEIREMAKKLGVRSFGKSKVELIREIQRAEGNFPCFGTAEGSCDQLDCCFRSLCLNTGKGPKKAKAKTTS
jgi:DNA polymerase/3'-5' exonuclease PolX